MRSNTILSTALCSLLLAGASSSVLAASGEELYKFKSCNNCHGDDGKSSNNGVPAVAGLDAARIMSVMEKMSAKKVHEGDSDACDVPPTTAEMQAIADWLAAK